VGLRADAWGELLGTHRVDVEALWTGILDFPQITPEAGQILPAIPQSPEDLAFAAADLEAGCRPESRIYEKVTWDYARRMVTEKREIVSSAFVHWSGDGADKTGRFFVNLHEQSQLWEPKSTRMDR
jgi:hypothetical protein